jgi:hypothetical protein
MAFLKMIWASKKPQQKRKPISTILTTLLAMVSLMGVITMTGCTGSSVIGKIVLTDVTITGPATVTEGSTNFYGVVAGFEDGSTMQVMTGLTWSVTEGPGSISDIGLYAAPAAVDADTQVTLHVSLTANGVTKEATKTVTLAKSTGPLKGIKIDGPDTVVQNTEAPFTLTATYDDGHTADVTAGAKWSVFGGPGSFSAPGTFVAPAQVSGDTLTTVLVRYTEGLMTVEASKVVVLTQTARQITGLAIAGPASVDEGASADFTATVTYEGGNTSDVTAQATWTISGVGSFETPGAYTAGSVEADSNVTIAASFEENGVTKEASRTVTVQNVDTSKAVTAMAITGPEALGAGETGNFTATATFDDDSTKDVTGEVTWSLSGDVTDPGTIGADGSYTAPASIAAEGVVLVTAKYDTASTSQELVLATPGEKKISGQVFDVDGNDVAGATLTCTYNNESKTTDASGYFSFRVPYGWSGTITPQSDASYFNPGSYTYENVKTALPDQTFTALSGVPGENLAPTATGDTVYTRVDTQVSFTLSASDPNGDTLTYAIVTQPAHGTLTGTAPNLLYIPAAGYEGADSFTFKASDGSLESLPATVSVDVQSVPVPPQTGDWVAPIGIPVPSFGLEETHWMYESATYDYGNGPEPYRMSNDGPYTHYVDNTHPNSTDSGNTYGTPDKPRKTIPTDYLKVGSVVEIHGNSYTQSVGGIHPLCASGSSSKPVFFRGASNATHPTLTVGLRLRGQYMIVENLKMSTCALTTSTGISISNASVRHCELSGGGGNALYASSYNGDTITNIVFYNNLIHDKGDIYSPNDEDAGGIAATAGVSYCWIIDNEIYNTSGSGVQIVSGSLSSMASTHHVFVGRNLIYRTRQSGVWSKQSVDCVFSENTVHDVINTSWSPSKGIGYQYGPERLWIINNHIYNCTFGVAAMSTSGLGFGTEAFIVGNVIHDIHHANDGTGYFNPNSSWSNAGVMLVGVGKNYVINNTIYNVDAGINSPSGGTLYMENNIIANVTESACQHIFLESSSGMSNSTVKNNVFYQNGSPIRIRWGVSNIYTLPAFQSATGKGTECVDANPLFVDPANDDFRLRSGSPAIDKGLTESVYDRFQSLHGLDIRKDLEGTPRPQGSKWDIGACEYK